MTERRALLDAAAFFDSAESHAILGTGREGARTVVQRFLDASYEDLGKAPRFLDEVDLERLLVEHLPVRFSARDPLAEGVEEVLDVYLSWLHEVEVVASAFEQKAALARACPRFVERVAAGDAHAGGLRGPGTTVRSRGDKVGRNDPCPCGSGRKFKKCCARLG